MDFPQQFQLPLLGQRFLLCGGEHRLRRALRSLPAVLAQMLVPKVLGDLAQPHRDLAGAVEADGLVEGLLGQLLCQVCIPALGQEKFIDGLGMLLVEPAHILHGHPPSFLFLNPFRKAFVTGKSKKPADSSAGFLICRNFPQERP